jgi:hypothetical protein
MTMRKTRRSRSNEPVTKVRSRSVIVRTAP